MSMLISLEAKNKQINNLLLKYRRDKQSGNYSAPIINVSSYNLNDTKLQQLEIGLKYSYVDRSNTSRKT